MSSPVTTPSVLAKTSTGLRTKVSALKVDSAVDIMSIHTMSPEVDDADDEDEEGMEFLRPCTAMVVATPVATSSSVCSKLVLFKET